MTIKVCTYSELHAYAFFDVQSYDNEDAIYTYRSGNEIASLFSDFRITSTPMKLHNSNGTNKLKSSANCTRSSFVCFFRYNQLLIAGPFTKVKSVFTILNIFNEVCLPFYIQSCLILMDSTVMTKSKLKLLGKDISE